MLSIPNPLKRVSSDEGEFDSPRKANDGLHLVHEHPVITRDQPLPQVKKYPQNEVKGWNQSKDELNLDKHKLIDQKHDIFKDAINSKGSKEDQYIINKFKNEGDSDGGGFNIYSKNDLGEYVEEELLKEESGGESQRNQNVDEKQMSKTYQNQKWSKEKIKQQNEQKNFDQNRKSLAQIVFSPSALKRGYGVGHANQYVEGVSPPPSQLSVINFHNYQKQNSRRVDYSEDVIQRMQTHQMNKDSKKLQNERKNYDLIQLSKNKKLRGSNHMATLSDFNKSFQNIERKGVQERNQSQEQHQIVKEDTNRSIQLINQQSLNSPFTQSKQKKPQKQSFNEKIAFKQSSDQEFNENSFENDYDELESDFKKQKKLSKLDTDPDNMRQSYYKQLQQKNTKKISQLEIKEQDEKKKQKKNNQIENSEVKKKNQIEKKQAKNQSPVESPLKNRNSNMSIKQFDSSQINSTSKQDVQKYFKDELEIFNTTKVNQRNNQTNFNTINEFGEIVERELNQKNNQENQILCRETDGMFMTLTSADRKGKHKPYQYVQKNIQQEFQDKIDKRLRYIMYTYTKNQEEIPNAMRQPVDSGGIRFLQEKSKFTEKGEKKKEDFFEEGVMQAQDKKIQKMRNKLNQSVDLAVIQERIVDREKRKYNEKPIYKQVTNKLTFQNEQFLQNIDKILDPKNSPILPAIIANEKIRQERKSQMEENHENINPKKDDNQLYSTSLPLVEEFQMQYESLKKQNITKYKKQDKQLDIAQAHTQYKESLQKQIRNKKKDKQGNEETFSKYSNESELINENQDARKDISFEDLQEYTNLSDLIDKSQQYLNYEDPILDAPIKQSKITAMTKEKEQHDYSVILNKKKQPKRRDSIIYMDLDKKQEDIKNNRIQIENIEEMDQVEKVFKMIHDYCAENLSVSYNMLDKHIEELLDPKVTVSPLLKYFNELAKHCNFRLPCTSILQFDQKFYKAYVQRLRDAQKMEVRWVRQSVVNESREMLEYAFNQAKQLLQTEVKHIIYEYDLLKIKIKELEQTNIKLNQTIYQQEMSLIEQRTYIQQLQQRSTAEDQELFKLNNGPGGGHDRVVQGDVISNIDAYNQNLTKHLQDFAFFLKIQISEKYQKDQQLERDGKSYLSQIKNVPAQNQDDKKKSALAVQGSKNKLNFSIKQSEIPQSQKEDEQSQFYQSKMSLFATLSRNIQNANVNTSITPDLEQAQNEQIFQQIAISKESLPPLKKFYWEEEVPKIDTIQQYQLEPFLRPQYNLYGGLIKVKMQDVSEIMSSEMYKYQKVQINQFKENIETLQSENFAIHEMLNQYGITNQRLKKENEDYIQTISDMKKEFDKLTKRIRQEAENQIDEIQKKCSEDMRKLRSFLTLEINVATTIKDMIIDQNKWQAEKLRKFGTLLRVPRIHFEYIEKHGIDEFVEFCEDVMKREKAIQENKESIQQRAQLRNKFSIMKIKKFADKQSSPLALKYESLTERIIEYPFRMELQKPKEDLSKMDPQDLAQLKVQRQMEKINWLQKKSVLDLSELIEKHKDRQPELLAMIHPDIKTQLLSNPHFFSNLEILEKKDPINKKVKDVKLFINAMKSQTYDKHFQGLQDNKNENQNNNIINQKFIELNRSKLSKSMNIKSGLFKNNLNSGIIEKFQNTTQTVKNSKGTSSSSRSKFKNTKQNFKNDEDFLETLLNQNVNLKTNPISPLDDDKIDPDEKLMLNQTSELNYQLSQENLDLNIQNDSILKNMKKQKNVLFSNQESSVLQGNIINQSSGNNTATNHYYSTKLVRGGQQGNNVIFTEQKQKAQPIFGQKKDANNINTNLDVNKKNNSNFRSNFNFGNQKYIKPNQYSNFMLKSPGQDDQKISHTINNPSNQRQNKFGNINEQSSEMIDRSVQQFDQQNKKNTIKVQNSPVMSIDQKYLQINDSNTKMTVGNSSSQISSQLVINMPFGVKKIGDQKLQRNQEAHYRSVNISQKRVSNIGEMDDTENTEYDEVNQ